MRECKGAGASRGALETNTQCGVVLAIDADHKLLFASVQPQQALKVAVAGGKNGRVGLQSTALLLTANFFLPTPFLIALCPAKPVHKP